MRRNRKPHRLHAKHWLLNAFTGIVVFTLGVAADVFIVRYMHSMHKPVNYDAVRIVPMDDGSLAWKKVE